MNRLRRLALALGCALSVSGASAEVYVEDLGTYNSFGCGLALMAAQAVSDHSFYCVRGGDGRYTLYEVYLVEVVTVH